MSYWSSETLRERLPAAGLIIPYDEARVKHCAYELGVGGEAFVTSKPGVRTQLAQGDRVEIPPGQFGLLVTHEIVAVPDDAIAFISIRAGVKFRGLVNVSGFHVDPGFKGRLKYAVYNAGSQAIVLDQGQPTFLIWYCGLDHPTADLYPDRRPMQDTITAEDVMKIHGEVASPAELKKKIDELRTGYDQKILALEKEQNIVRALIFGLFIAMAGVFIRWFSEGRKEAVQPTVVPKSSIAADPKSESPLSVAKESGVSPPPEPAAGPGAVQP